MDPLLIGFCVLVANSLIILAGWRWNHIKQRQNAPRHHPETLGTPITRENIVGLYGGEMGNAEATVHGEAN